MRQCLVVRCVLSAFSFQLVASFWSCLCRPDAGAMLGLLVLTALNESLLYFSRVAAGATVLTLSIDWLWLRFQAIPGQDASSLLRNISSFEGLLALLSGRALLAASNLVLAQRVHKHGLTFLHKLASLAPHRAIAVATCSCQHARHCE